MVGLSSKPEHNGKVGSILGNQGANRIQVRQADGIELVLRPANLKQKEAVEDNASVDRTHQSRTPWAPKKPRF